MEFIDSEGSSWIPRVTVNTIRRFEDRTGIGIFEAALQTILQDQTDNPTGDEAEEGVSLHRVVEMSSAIWGKVGNIGIFLYECCVPLHDREALGVDEFCERITKENISDAMSISLTCLFEFFPDIKGTDDTEESGGGSEDPLPDGPGNQSTE